MGDLSSNNSTLNVPCDVSITTTGLAPRAVLAIMVIPRMVATAKSSFIRHSSVGRATRAFDDDVLDRQRFVTLGPRGRHLADAIDDFHAVDHSAEDAIAGVR